MIIVVLLHELFHDFRVCRHEMPREENCCRHIHHLVSACMVSRGTRDCIVVFCFVNLIHDGLRTELLNNSVILFRQPTNCGAAGMKHECIHDSTNIC
jgi:hypothetical protein